MHIHDSYVRRLNILRSPIIFPAAVNHVPPQIIHRDHLRWHSGFLDEWPGHLPLIAGPHYSQIAHLMIGPDYGRPTHVGTDLSLVRRSVKRMEIVAVEAGIAPQAGMSPRQISYEILLAEF